MRIGTLTHLDDQELTSLARWAGLFALALTLLLAIKATEAPFDGNGFWYFLALLVQFSPSAALIFFATERLRKPDEQSQTLRVLVLAFVAGFLVIAVVASQERLLTATPETGEWAAIDVLLRRGVSSVALFWLLIVATGPLIHHRVAVALVAAAAFVAATVALEARGNDHPFLSDAWEWVQALPLLVRMPVLRLVASYFPHVPRTMQKLAWAAAAVTIVAAVAYGLKTTEFTPTSGWWIPVSQLTSAGGGALMVVAVARALAPRAVILGVAIVGASTLAWSGYVLIDTYRDGEPLWFGVTMLLSLLVMLMPPILFSEVGRRLDARQVAVEAV